MKLEFLRQTPDNDRLILIYAGWSTSAGFYAGIDRDGWDVAVVSGYDTDHLDLSGALKYSTIYIFAWSMGVWAATRSFPSERVAHAVAINGTPWPMHNHYGIPEAVFKATCENLDERNLKKFRRRMVADKQQMDILTAKLPASDDIDYLKSELQHIMDSDMSADCHFPWTRAYIAAGDRIFPAEAQSAAWQRQGTAEIITTGGPHYSDLPQIINSIIQNPVKVGYRFEQALTTYDSAAIPQRQTAGLLVEKLSEFTPRRGGKMLEIGPATGILTRMASEKLKPSEIDFVELFKIPPFNVAPTERYWCGDAERWLSGNDGKWDFIISSSAVQWFVDLDAFLKNAAAHLKKEGVLAISTFTAGNLKELNEVRPYGMLYHSEQRIMQMAKRHFKRVETSVADLLINFQHPREALLHLKHTGAAGSSQASGSIADLLKAISISGEPRLTYRPMILICGEPTKR